MVLAVEVLFERCEVVLDAREPELKLDGEGLGETTSSVSKPGRADRKELGVLRLPPSVTLGEIDT